MVHGHRLFHIDRFPRRGHRFGIVGMGIGRRGNIDRIDLGVVDQLLGIVIPAGHPVACGVILGQRPIAAHHRHQRRTRRLLQARPTLYFRHIATADNPPADGFHGC